MNERKLTFDEALLAECEHGFVKVLVCPKCNPEKYVLTDAQMARARELAERHGLILQAPTRVDSVYKTLSSPNFNAMRLMIRMPNPGDELSGRTHQEKA